LQDDAQDGMSDKQGSGDSREPQVLSAQSLINGAISEKKALDEI
jgi:hypothetical protein